ncbi:MAG: hypothetical protein JWM96_1351 [Alphaproteobacteria bacterium]|nr:hypothetical protein [Alphaproteobacteria bacterium]
MRVSAREVETDPAFVMRHIDEAVGRRRLEFAIMPPSKPPIWDLSDQPITPTKAIMSRRPRPASLRAPAERRPPSRSRRRGRQEPSWVVLGLGVLVVLAFFGNWFGAQDAYWDLSRRGADRVAGSLTDGLGAQPPIPRRVEGATACIGPTPACDQKLAVANAQLLADRMNLAVPAPPPPPDLRCGGRVSPVVIVTFQAAGATTVVEVLPGCHVFRTTSGEVRRATPGVIGQITAPGPA